MATTTAVNSTSFTKAFLVEHKSFKARAEFLFDAAKNSLTLNRLNFWENKDTVHLTIPLADDNLSPEDTILLYSKAAELALIWARQFPIEKNRDGTYKTTPWESDTVFQAHSPEEGFLYWMLYYFLPKGNDEEFVEILQKGMAPTANLDLMFESVEDMLKIKMKLDKQQPLTTKEREIVEKVKPAIPKIEEVHSDPAILEKMLAQFRKIKYPQVMHRSLGDNIETTVRAAKTELAKRSQLYAHALQKRPSKTKIEEQD